MQKKPKIRYTLVAYKETILTDYFKKYGDYVVYSTDFVFRAIPPNLHASLKDDHRHYFSLNSPEGVKVLLYIDPKFDQQVAIKLTAEIKNKLLEVYSTDVLKKCKENELVGFKPLLKEIVEYYNSNYTDKTSLVLEKTEEMRSVVSENLQQLIDRSRNIRDLDRMANNININSAKLVKQSTQLRKNALRRYYFFVLIVALLIIGLILVILFCLCGLKFDRC